MNFKESVNVYLEACKCGPAGGKCSNGRAASVCVSGGKCSNGREAAVYAPGTQMKSIKPFEAVKRLMELGIPKSVAIESVNKAIADRSKIESITNRICCECADEIDSVLDEGDDELSGERARLAKAKEHFGTMKDTAYDNYSYNKNVNARLMAEKRHNSKIQAKRDRLNSKADSYEDRALRYAQGDKAVRTDKIKKAIAGILMAAAVGGTAMGTKNAYDSSLNNRNEHDAYERAYNENSTKAAAAKKDYDEKSGKFILDFKGRKGIKQDEEDFERYGKEAERNKEQMHGVDEKERGSFGYKIPGIKQIKSKVYDESYGDNKMNSIREEIIGNASVACFANINEEAVITESIKNGSVSKGLRKQIAKLEAGRDKADGAGKKEIDKAISTYKKAADDFEKVEQKYSAGDPGAKSEYKDLKSKYSSQVRKINFQSIAKGGAITAAVAAGVAGAAVLFCRYDPSDAEKIKDAIGSGVNNIFKGIKGMFISPSEKLANNMEKNVNKMSDSDEGTKIGDAIKYGKETGAKKLPQGMQDSIDDKAKKDNMAYEKMMKTLNRGDKKITGGKGASMFKEDILNLDHVLNG